MFPLQIAFAYLSLGVGKRFDKEARAMELHVWVKEILAEGVHLSGEALWDMLVTEMFAHDGPVLGFGQTVVVAVPAVPRA